MNTVKGKVEKGKILVLEPVDEFEGREVTIMLDEDLNDKSNGIGNDASKTEIRAGWEQFMKTVKENQIESEITDMAHQHDHRLYDSHDRDKELDHPILKNRTCWENGKRRY